jgi:phosphoribosyl 1,2-cyclic phosphate phosphodiesterase
MSLSITILGCGSSGGVPRPGSGWGACDPANPRNRRRRCAILIERKGHGGVTRVLVDTGPDLREQLIDARVEHLDGVVLTHEHADHTHGIDDLRPLVLHMRRTIDIYMTEVTSALMRDRFRYIFEMLPGSGYPPILIGHIIAPLKPFTVEGAGGPLEILPLEVAHGEIMALALKVGGAVYMPDVSAIPADVEPHLAGLDLLILDALRPRPHPTHFSLSEALACIERTRPQRAVLTNLHTDLDYGALSGSLPQGVMPAHDGLELVFADRGSPLPTGQAT